MMQEHPQHLHVIKRASAHGERTYSWTSQPILNFEFTLVLLRRRSLKAFKASAFVI
jgi:hypothetical protein